MSRTSINQYNDQGQLINGYDYEKQCWVIDGVIQDCGHPQAGEKTIIGDIFAGCSCYGRKHAGELTNLLTAEQEAK